MLTFNATQTLYAAAGVVLIVFIIVEWRIHQMKKATQKLIEQMITMNNGAIENLLDRKDEVFKTILNRMTDEIFDGHELLEARLNILEKHSENE